MKVYFSFLIITIFGFNTSLHAQTAVKTKTATTPRLFMDVHYLPAGTVKFEDVAAAHTKDLAVEKKYGVHFQKYWVDESRGAVYCLSSAPDTMSIIKTHIEAHGLLPQKIYEVTDGVVALPKGSGTYYLDVHNLGAGNVTAADVAKAHEKDLAVQKKYDVNFINYWVDEKKGVVVCLSQAKDSSKVIQTHKEAHGLLPDSIMPVKQGQ
ncbi:MAG: hypothetical protein JWP81_1580 [Ferruginibacter sp.]|nr:hypothetical protein [Ferruginibacter sp.]